MVAPGASCVPDTARHWSSEAPSKAALIDGGGAVPVGFEISCRPDMVGVWVSNPRNEGSEVRDVMNPLSTGCRRS
jgi:hypothetical protein